MIFAVLAQTAEIEFMAFHHKSILLAEGLDILPRWRTIGQIQNSPAAVANKVGVGVGICVEAFLSMDDPHTADDALFRQLVQITVDRTQAQVGILILELLVDPVRRGVAFGGTHQAQDRVTLFAASNDSHIVTSITITFSVKKDSIFPAACKEEFFLLMKNS